MVDFGTPYGDNTKRFTVSHLLDLPRNGCCFLQEPSQNLPQHVDIEDGDKTEGEIFIFVCITHSVLKIFWLEYKSIIQHSFPEKIYLNEFLFI